MSDYPQKDKSFFDDVISATGMNNTEEDSIPTTRRQKRESLSLDQSKNQSQFTYEVTNHTSLARKPSMRAPPTQSDFISASYTSSEAISQALKERYQANKPYSLLGSSVLLDVNRVKKISLNSEEQSKYYTSIAESFDEDKPGLDAHIFSIAVSSWQHAVRDNMDQTVVLLGESGSGKTHTHKLFLQQLLSLSTSVGGREIAPKVHNGSKKINTVLDAFGSSRSSSNPSASRFSRYTEYQLDSVGRLIGIKLLDYLLDRSKVTALTKDTDVHNPSEERNYNIFYYLIAGANAEERETFKLNSVKHESRSSGNLKFSFLGQTSTSDDDHREMDKLRDDLKSLGIGRRLQQQLYSLIAGILHLGNVEFTNGEKNQACTIVNYYSLTNAAELFGVDAASLATILTTSTKLFNKELCSVFLTDQEASKHRDNLAMTIYKLIFEWLIEHINTRFCLDDCDIFIGVLDIAGCHDNSKSVGGSNGLRELLGNYGNDCLRMYMHRQLLDKEQRLQDEGVLYEGSQYSPKYYNSLRGSIATIGGLFKQIDKVKKEDTKLSAGIVGKKLENRLNKLSKGLDLSTYYDFNKDFIANISSGPQIDPKEYVTVPLNGNYAKVRVKHGSNELIDYDLTDFIDYNTSDVLPADFVGIFRGNGRMPSSSFALARDIFSDRLIATEKHARDENVVTAAVSSSIPKRTPSLRRKNSHRTTANSILSIADTESTLSYGFNLAFQELIDTIADSNSWFILCIKPNDRIVSDKFDARKVAQQIKYLDVISLRKMFSVYDYTREMDLDDFVTKYAPIIDPLQIDKSRGPHFACKELVDQSNWNWKDMSIGRNTVFLSETAFISLEDELRLIEAEFNNKINNNIQNNDKLNLLQQRQTYAYENSNNPSRSLSRAPSDSSLNLLNASGDNQPRASRGTGARVSIAMNPNTYEEEDGITEVNDSEDIEEEDSIDDKYINDITFADGVGVVNKDLKDPSILKSNIAPDAAAEEQKEALVETGSKMTGTRKRWLCCTWSMTWCCWPICLSRCGKMKRKDIQLAWREKVALCLIITFLCLAYLFFIIGLGRVICPKQKILSTSEIEGRSKANSPLAYMNGRVYNFEPIIRTHLDYGVREYVLDDYVGKDISYLFNKTLYFDQYCPGFELPEGWDYLSQRQAISSAEKMHNITQTQGGQGRNYISYMNQYAAYRLGYTWKYIRENAVPSRRLIVIYDNVYDVTTYFNAPFFNNENIVTIFANYLGTDATEAWETQVKARDAQFARNALNCMNSMFYIGVIDTRDTPSCQFSNYVLLAATCFIVFIIFAKFVSALRFGSKKEPEEHDKFVICQIPCYTESEESLTRSIQSLAAMKYDDSRKLLCIICDGMIVGSGNDRPTPQIVLDILGISPDYDPEPLAFQSLGEGDRQLNYGKIYSGLYEYMGHAVPYVVIVKVGSPYERSRPGNRGKRDSQMILMRFLSRVHFNEAMTPLELEMYHHLKNIIGVSPSFYEYILMVDADTSVYQDALLQLISTMVNDSKIMGLCGETLLQNEKQSWITMIQVYEYFISHHLAKSFESLFGTVTCLPGCFCMYRVRTPLQNKPLLISPEVLSDYAENRVDTLHMKNLLHLGEDRYLTTLMLKHFPNMKTCFTGAATCMTFAPEQWKILLSQRRRWINSTVHNLLELSVIDGLCGFCCFSMRFIVMLDLFSTFVQPATLAYIGYLIYTCVSEPDDLPLISLILIAAVYGLQAFIFIIKQQWAQIGWMFVYILAMPVFSFYIPIYSFWHFDDFSWGNTRVVIGDKGKKMVYSSDVKPFDPNSIPLETWEDYERELFEKINAKFVEEQKVIQGLKQAQIQDAVLSDLDSQNGQFYNNNNNSFYR